VAYEPPPEVATAAFGGGSRPPHGLGGGRAPPCDPLGVAFEPPRVDFWGGPKATLKP
jgi:hypothetical protein